MSPIMCSLNVLQGQKQRAVCDHPPPRTSSHTAPHTDNTHTHTDKHTHTLQGFCGGDVTSTSRREKTLRTSSSAPCHPAEENESSFFSTAHFLWQLFKTSLKPEANGADGCFLSAHAPNCSVFQHYLHQLLGFSPNIHWASVTFQFHHFLTFFLFLFVKNQKLNRCVLHILTFILNPSFHI